MATSQMNKVIDCLRRAVLGGSEADLTDGQLLECFVSHREEAAIAALVRRHGPMVWGLCHRVLPFQHDAEDAFQATFLVLLRKAASIMPREMVANWLYGVAHQTALKARATTMRRKGRERQVNEMPEPEAGTEPDLWPDLQPLLDQELSRLADKYRLAIVLCDLEGKTRKEAARQLKIPEGTLSSRLTTARTMLAKRLARHGFALTGGAVAAVLSEKAALASVPTSVLSATITTVTLVASGEAASTGLISAKVAALTEGVIQAMFVTKLKTIAAVALIFAVVLAGGGWLAHAAWQPDDRNPAKDAPPPDLAVMLPPQPKQPADAPAPLRNDQPLEAKIDEPRHGLINEEPNNKTKAALIAQTGHDGLISATIQSADGKWLVTGGYDSTVKLWDLSTGRLVRTFEMQVRSDLGVHRLALVGNNKWLVASNNTNRPSTQIWELVTGKVLYRSEEHAVFAGLSADGKVLAMSAGRHSGDGNVYPVLLLDTASGKEIRQISQPNYDAVFDAEGKRIILVDKGVLRSFDSDTGKEVFTVRDANLPAREQFYLMPYSASAGFSADGLWLYAVTGKTVRMWDTRSGKMERSFAIPKEVYAASLSANGKWLVTQPRRKDFVGTPIEKILAEDQLSRLWDTAAGKEVSTVASSAPLRIFNGLVPPEGDGKHIVDVQEVWPEVDGRAMSNIIVREAATAKVVSAITTQSQLFATNLVVSRDGKWLVANNTGNSRLLAWDLVKGKQLNLPKNPFKEDGVGYINNVGSPNPILSGNGKLVALARSKAHLWDLAEGKYLRAFVGSFGGPNDDFGPDEHLTSMTVSQDGKWLATGVERIQNGRERWGGLKLPPTPVVRLWDLTSGKEIRSFGKDGRATTLKFMAGDKWLLEGDDQRDLDLDFDNKNPFIYRAKLWEVATGKEVRNFAGISPFAVALTDDGKFLAAAQGHDVVLHNLATGKDVRTFKGHKHDVSSAAFSADGKWLVAGSSDYKWRPPPKDADLAPAAPWEARVWDVATGKLVNVFRQPDVVIHVSLSRDGKRLLTHTESQRSWHKDNTIRVWDVASGKLLCHVPRAGLAAGAIRPRQNGGVLTDDGERLIWIDHDHTVRVSDAATGKELCRLVSFASGAWVVYDADGRYDSANDGKIEGVHWAVGTETRPLNQLRDRYYDPGLLAKHIGPSKEPLRKLEIR